MNKTKTLLIRIITVVFFVALAVLMYFLGRGHTVYIDNKKLEYNGTTYDTPYKVEVYVGGERIDLDLIRREVYVGGERIAKLYDKERGASTCIGANFSMDLVVTQEKGGSEESYTYSIKLPYDKDGLIINIPGLMAGLGEDAYMTEFISTAPEETVDEEVVTDEFGITMDEPSAEETAAG